MAKKEQLKSLKVDVEKNLFEINGRDISKSLVKMTMECDNGQISLMITEDTLYHTSDGIRGGEQSGT